MTWSTGKADSLPGALAGITSSSWRWECQGDYSAIDAKLLQRWRDGLGRDPGDDRAWVDYIQGLRRRGISFERARLLTDPLTEYLRCQLDVAYMNVNAGEDIRWVGESTAGELAMPDYDYYLIDDGRVVALDFAADGTLAGIHVSADAEVVAQHRRWRDLIWPHAVPHEQYRQRHR
ncbi:hypothetical protein EV191_1012 [Tamaricihabitans halophyticus]|uniref:DUF6879 domain-containing protein n=1 Tax=Tamaricihabitans halophyticus TaxID=1262583 RepID=A0A4R2R0C0_9PSEU|nr:DUF6879 family protein [Tamaricihabitans halophyticus]TCP56062.1 hypothetical protein EV191_1012 [Tamaricihabitans halophyticus]